MNPMPELTPMLKQLRLSGFMDSLEVRNKQAIEDSLSYTEFLALLLQDETARRSSRKLDLRLRRAGFRQEKTLEAFDCMPSVWSFFQPAGMQSSQCCSHHAKFQVVCNRY